jgi:hypothetical protein
VIIQGAGPNDTSTIIDGVGTDGIQVGADSAGGAQMVVQNCMVQSDVGSGISIFGAGSGVIARNVTFGNCRGAALVCAHGAEGAFQNTLRPDGTSYYTLFLGTSYGCLAQAVTRGQFTGGETALWAIGRAMTVTLATLFCANATMNLGGLRSVNPRLVSGNQVGADDLAEILTGGNISAIPGNLGTASGSPYVNNGSIVT